MIDFQSRTMRARAKTMFGIVNLSEPVSTFLRVFVGLQQVWRDWNVAVSYVI